LNKEGGKNGEKSREIKAIKNKHVCRKGETLSRLFEGRKKQPADSWSPGKRKRRAEEKKCPIQTYNRKLSMFFRKKKLFNFLWGKEKLARRTGGE